MINLIKLEIHKNFSNKKKEFNESITYFEEDNFSFPKKIGYESISNSKFDYDKNKKESINIINPYQIRYNKIYIQNIYIKICYKYTNIHL